MMSGRRREGGRREGVRNNARKIVERLSNSFREVSLIIFCLVLEDCLYTIYMFSVIYFLE